MNLKKIIKKILITFVSILFIGGIGVWIEYNYNNIFNYNEVQQEIKGEIKQEYVKTLCKNKSLTKGDVIDIILEKKMEKAHGEFVQSSIEEFIVGRIESYEINGDSILFKINSKSDVIEYNINNFEFVDINNKNSYKLKICDNILKTEDNKDIDLKDMTAYIIVNEVHEKNSDNVIIVNN